MQTNAQGASIGTTLLSTAGTAVGSYFGGPIGGAIGGMLGGLLGSALFRNRKPIIPDLNLMNSSYGNPIPIIYGSVRIAGTVIWMSTLDAKSHSAKGGGGGKGIAGPQMTSLWQSVMVAFCEGEAALTKLYLDGRLFIDNTNGTNGVELQRQNTFAIRQYTGTEDQLPDFRYTQWADENIQGGGAMCPAMRNLCHLVFDRMDLANYGNRIPQVTAVWTRDPDYTTTFKQLMRWPDDVSTNANVWSTGPSNGIAVDWTRGTCYQLSSDGTVRAFDLRSGTCLMAKKAADIGCESFSMLPTIGPFQGICCGQGGYPYLYTTVNSYSIFTGSATTLFIWALDPNSMTATNEAPYPVAWADGITSMVVVTSVAPDGNVDTLVGTFNFANNIGVFDPYINKLTFTIIPMLLYNIYDLTMGGAFSWTHIVIGHQDLVEGTTEVWFFNGSYGDPAGQIYVHQAVLGGGLPISLLALNPAPLIATLSAATFGLTYHGSSAQVSPVYDPADGSFLLMNLYWSGNGAKSGPFSAKWAPPNNDVDPTSEGLLWTNFDWGGADVVMFNTTVNQGQIVANVGWSSQAGATVANLATGSTSISPVTPARNLSSVSNQQYDGPTNSMVYQDADGNLWIASFQRQAGNGYPIANIILDIAARVGLDASMIDVTLITGTVAGYGIFESKSAGAALMDLCHFAQIDMIESDYKLKFVPLGQPSAATITEDELISADPNDPTQYWVPKKAQEVELPLSLLMKFADPNLDYQPNAVQAQRTALPFPTVFSKRRIQISSPIVYSAVDAQQTVEKLLYRMWAERDVYDTILPSTYLNLDPGDNITVVMNNGDTYVTRIEQADTGIDFSVRPLLASEDATVYGGSTSRGPLQSGQPQVVTPSPFAQMLMFNTPLLRDEDDLGGTATRFYYAVDCDGETFMGGVYNSLDGANWTVMPTPSSGANWGYAVGTLGGTPAAFATDRVNTLVVRFTPGTAVPSSCAYVDLMNQANPALVGSEIIQFQTVTDNGDGTFTLSNLLRGCRGTDWAIGTHAQGERVILLQAGLLMPVQLPLAQINQTETWKCLPLGRFMNDVPPTGFTERGYDLMPYAPVNFSRTASGPNLVLAWYRRTRIGGLLSDGTDAVQLAEETEAYEAYLLPSAAALATFDPTNPATYTRAFTGLTSPSVTYTSAAMATDGFVPATATLFLVVYQVSAVVGRGFRGYQPVPAF